MSNSSFADDLDRAATEPGLPREAAAMMRRAALRLRNVGTVPLDPEWHEMLEAMAAMRGVSRNGLVRAIVRDWLNDNAPLSVAMLEEDGDAS